MPFEYENPDLPGTMEVKNVLKKEYDGKYRQEDGYKVIIQEKEGDVVRELTLDDQFAEKYVMAIKGNEFDEKSILLEKYNYNLKEENHLSLKNIFQPDNSEFPSSREYNLASLKIFKTAKYPR